MRRMQGILGSVSVLALATGLGTGSAWAQLDEIIVTAQKREQSLQKVPISVTAFSGDILEDMQIVNIADLRGFTPNLYVEPALGQSSSASIYMRGSGQINPSFFFDAPIPIYVDGVYQARAFGSLVDLYDIERVEVLRGPQGTLFGRNASAGAIQVITKKPPLEEMDFTGAVSYGTEEQRNVNATFGAPLVEGKVGIRAAITYRKNDGFMTNANTGEKAFEDDVLSGRASLLVALSDQTDLTISTNFLRDRSDTAVASAFNPDPDGDPYTFETNFTDEEDYTLTDTFTVSATLNSDFDAFDLTSITAYRTVNFFGRTDGDGRAGPPGIFENFGTSVDEWQFTQEVFLNGDQLGGTPIDWTVGAFYLHEFNDTFFSIGILPFLPTTVQFTEQETDAVGVYGQATYPVTDRLDLTGGLRYSWDSKNMMTRQTLADGTPVPAFVFDDSITVSKVTWTGSANFAATDDVNLYVRAGTGFRAGNFNGNAFNLAAVTSGALATEKIFSVEGGIKSQWFDDRLRFNAAYYYKEVKDLQVELLTPMGITNLNLDVDVMGVEVEVAITPFEGLDIFGNIGTLDDEIPGGGELPRAADYTYQVGFNYRHDTPGAGSIILGANYAYTDDYFNGRPDDVLRAIEGYGILDASLTFETEDGHWAFTLSGQNVTEEFYQVSSFNIPGLVTVQIPNRPQTWLATIAYKF